MDKKFINWRVIMQSLLGKSTGVDDGCMKMPGIKNIMRKPNIISIIIILVKKKYTKLIWRKLGMIF